MKVDLDAYLETVKRLEPDITPVDLPAAAASIAISLVRIANALDELNKGVMKQNDILHHIGGDLWRNLKK